jgi:hypothetical protein
MYDRLDLERFDDQARALKHAEETKRDEDDEDDEVTDRRVRATDAFVSSRSRVCAFRFF